VLDSYTLADLVGDRDTLRRLLREPEGASSPSP
jgi:hypothetical protein